MFSLILFSCGLKIHKLHYTALNFFFILFFYTNVVKINNTKQNA